MSNRLSIVVPALDEALHLGATLEALSSARARGAEVLVVDGGSSDGTVALAQPLADRVLRSPRGRAVQLNAGAAAARGQMLLFLHADSMLPAEFDCMIEAALAGRALAWGRFDVRIEEQQEVIVIDPPTHLVEFRDRVAVEKDHQAAGES